MGNTGLYSRDWDLVEQRTADGSIVRFNPPLRLCQWPLRVGSTWSYMTTIETSQGAKIPPASRNEAERMVMAELNPQC